MTKAERIWDDGVYAQNPPGLLIFGWVDRIADTSRWYGRTSGTKDIPPARGEFDTEQEAKDFVQLMSALEKP